RVEIDCARTEVGSSVVDDLVLNHDNVESYNACHVVTTATSAIFYGHASSTYRFYSIAFDLVGNREPAKTTAEATTLTPAGNPIDEGRWFVRQHYLDFLNREPDASGLQFWTNEILSCGSNAACIELKRINVSAAYFLSIE